MARPRFEVVTADMSDRQFLFKDQSGRLVANDDGELIIGAALDSKSITKRELGNLGYGTQISVGPMQLAHPEIGAAVEHTEKFWKNPYWRVAVSMDPIMSVMYAPDPYAAGEHVRRLHEGIHGRDHAGRKFNALSPEAFYWAHKTFEYGVQNFAEHYDRKFIYDKTDEDADEKRSQLREQIQLESATWYSYYGMPMNMVTPDAAANVEYHAKMLDERLEMTPSAQRAINMALERNPPRPEAVPKRIWLLAKLALMPTTEVMSLLTIGELSEDFRHKFGIPFTPDQQAHLDHVRNVVKTFWTPMPRPIRYYKKAYDADLRERNGQHKNQRDRVIHEASTRVIGLAAGAFNTINSVRSKIAA